MSRSISRPKQTARRTIALSKRTWKKTRDLLARIFSSHAAWSAHTWSALYASSSMDDTL